VLVAIAPVVLGDMAPYYRVTVPPGREPVYEWAPVAFLALAVLSVGWWLVRSRTVRTGPGRALLWLAAGGLAVSYSAWWVWSHRYAGTIAGDWMSSVAVYMPLLWLALCGAVVVYGRRRARGRQVAGDASTEVVAESSAAPDRAGGI
jgi:apolipoprotein N-acyltransferase